MKQLKQQRAVVTGASSGIGQSIAFALAAAGVRVHAVARHWQDVDVQTIHPDWQLHDADLTSDHDVARFCTELGADIARPLDILVHSAGLCALGKVAHMPVQVMDALYQINVRAPFVVTQKLLPSLVKARGQVVLINSSSGVVAKADMGAYSASKFALKALADALREEVNGDGVRVISIYPSKTASTMQYAMCQQQGKPYQPELLVQPIDVAQMVLASLATPDSAEVSDVHIRPMQRHAKR